MYQHLLQNGSSDTPHFVAVSTLSPATKIITHVWPFSHRRTVLSPATKVVGKLTVTNHFVAWTIMSISSCFLARVTLCTFKVQFVAVKQCDEYIGSCLPNQKDRPKPSVSNRWFVQGSHPRAEYKREVYFAQLWDTTHFVL